MPPVDSSRLRAILLPWLLFLPPFLVLYGLVPYTFSHLGAGASLVSVFHAMTIMWERFPDFQHGIIVPFLVALLIYLRRKQFKDLPIQGWAPGVVLVALSLAIFWAGRRVDNQYIGFFSIQLLLAAYTVWIFGWRWLAVLAFPIAFLLFAWPMPFLDNLVAFPLRVIMSTASVSVLQFLGIDAIQNGTAIVSAPDPQLHLGPGAAFAVDVADPCSGIRSLFALMMVAALGANLFLEKPWQRVILFLSSIPMAVFGNLVRILALTLGTIIAGPKIAIGSLEHPSLFHMAAGYAVFLVALTGLFGIATLLKISPRDVRQGWQTLRLTLAAARQRSPSSGEPAPASPAGKPTRPPEPAGDVY